MINLKLIKKSIYFKDLDDQDFNALLRCIQAKARNYKENEYIVTQNESTKYIYLIISGFARESFTTIDGDTVFGQDYKTNQLFGLEYNFLKDKTYRSALQALSDCTVLICDRYRFTTPCESTCYRHLSLINLTFKELSRLIIEYKGRILISSHKKTKEKVMGYLNTLAKENKSSSFYIPYNREELAIFLGVERTALSKELSDLKKEGLIDYNRNYFKINDHQK